MRPDPYGLQPVQSGEQKSTSSELEVLPQQLREIQECCSAVANALVLFRRSWHNRASRSSGIDPDRLKVEEVNGKVAVRPSDGLRAFEFTTSKHRANIYTAIGLWCSKVPEHGYLPRGFTKLTSDMLPRELAEIAALTKENQ